MSKIANVGETLTVLDGVREFVSNAKFSSSLDASKRSDVAESLSLLREDVSGLLAHHDTALREAETALKERLAEYDRRLPLRDEFEYTLHAVLMHGGGAFSGHYWSYVRSETGEWWMFNDTRVTRIENIDEKLVEAEQQIYCAMFRKKSTNE